MSLINESESKRYNTLRYQVLKILKEEEDSEKLMKRFKSIPSEKRLLSFIKKDLEYLHPILRKNNILFDYSIPDRILKEPTFEELKSSLIIILEKGKVEKPHLVILKSKLSEDSLTEYVKKHMKKYIPYLNKNGFSLIKNPQKVDKERKYKWIWTRIIYTPMGNKR